MKKLPLILFALFVVAVVFFGIIPSPTVPESEERMDTASPLTPKAPQAVREGAISATIVTARGEIVLALYPKAAPKTVENFTKLSGEGFYDGVLFHRVVDGFVIQAGDPLSKDGDPSNDGQGGPGYTFEDEMNAKALGLSEDVLAANFTKGYRYREDLPSLHVDVGALAMANSGSNTNGSQFFIVTESAQPHLDGLHTVFGEVISGMGVVRAIVQGDRIETIRIVE